MPERVTGTVAKWLNHKGIGFITPEGAAAGEKDILVHYEQIKQETENGFKTLVRGTVVEYEVENDPRDELKTVAVNVTGVDGTDCEAKKKGVAKDPESEEPAAEPVKKASKGKGKGKKGKGKGKKGKGKGKKGKGKGKGKSAASEE